MTQNDTTLASTTDPDLIDQLVGLQPDSPVAQVRAQRPEVVRYAQSSYTTLFAPPDPLGLTLVERGQAALRAAALENNPTLTAYYRHLLVQLGESTSAAVERFPDGGAVSARQAAILRHVDLLTREPLAATPAHLALLQAAGLSTRNIVTLSQLIAFVSFQVRTVVGLQLLQGNHGPVVSSGAGGGSPSYQRLAREQPSNQPPQGFTLEALGWAAWLDTLNLADATPEQVAVLEESTPTAKSSPYYLLLVQDVDVLRARSRLYNAIMYGPRGLARADRELAAVATSRVNGCPYCASIHAQRYAQLTKQPTIVQRLWEEGVEIPLEPRARAVVDYAVKVTQAPAQMSVADLALLRQLGLNDGEILDLTHVIAMFAWANRLMQTLGEPVTVS